MQRTIKEYEALTGDQALTPAERQLIEACGAGLPCVLGDGQRPEAPSPERQVRAGLLRYLILGGGDDCRTATQGVLLKGAYVTDKLDLDFGTAVGLTNLVNCRFDQPIQALQTRFELLSLSGSACPGLMAQGAEVTGNLFLRTGFHATGWVSLSGATIGGQLDCSGGRFENADGEALNVEGAQVTGNLFLGTGFHAKGRVSLSGAKIGGLLDCSGGRFENAGGDALNAQRVEVTGSLFLRTGFHATGRVSLSGAVVGGQLECHGGWFANADSCALMGHRLQVAGGFIWREVCVAAGWIDFSSASVGSLMDDLDSWPVGTGRLILDGFTYGRISAAFTDAPSRLEWLRRGTVWQGTFFPQPYTQLANVLGQMGKIPAAADILIERDRLLAAHYRSERWPEGARTWSMRPSQYAVRGSLVAWDWLKRATTGYGYRPLRVLPAGIIIYVIALVLAHFAWRCGDMTPNSDVMLMSDQWRLFAEDPAVTSPAENWSAADQAGRDWETFSSFGYALDLVVPLLDLGQTDAWAPSPARGWPGAILWFMRWVLAFSGWVISGLAVAAISASIKQARE